MNKLLQTDSGLIATQEDLYLLQNKDHCRILTISDSHGGYKIFFKIIQQYGSHCDAIIFCGDGIGDLVEILEQAKNDDSLKEALPAVIAFVRGNGDPSIYPVSFNVEKTKLGIKNNHKKTLIVPEEQILVANNTRFFITHGHNQGVYFGLDQLGLTASYHQCQIGVYGHTHVSRQDVFPNIKLVNPGSITRPRDGDTPGFAIITVEKTFTDIAFIKISKAYSNNPEFKVV